MLKVEYLVFIEKKNIKCSDIESFNHLIQSNPEIKINKDTIIFSNKTFNYIVNSGKIKTTNENYFHISLESEKNNIDEYIKLLRAVKSILYLVNNYPQVLFDGVSLHFSNLAYPLIFEIENLMRKLITKFMLTNVGMDWIKDRVPDDIKNSIRSLNQDHTYLHNIDFIQLKIFLFSENYLLHKEELITKLKNAKSIKDLKLKDIQSLVPKSNWENFFSKNIEVTKEQLIKEWDELYDLRCKIAHNRSFSKDDYQKVVHLYESLKKTILNAISNLNMIEISPSERDDLTENIALKINSLYGSFIISWHRMTLKISELVQAKLIQKDSSLRPKTFMTDLTLLYNEGIMDKNTFEKIRSLFIVRNIIIHHTHDIHHENVEDAINQVNKIITLIDGWL